MRAGTLEQKGEEEIEIGDKKLKCRVVERVTKIGDSESRTKMWVSDEVPGGLVKSEVSSDGKVTTRNVVLSWEKKEKK